MPKFVKLMNFDNNGLAKQIVSVTQEVFATMVMIDIKELGLVDHDHENIRSNITSMLGLGGGLRGMVAVHCPEPVARSITGAFLGTEVTSIDNDVKDAIGEIANMVAGGLKTYLALNQIHVELAIPTSIVGKSFRTSGLAGAVNVIVPFLCDSGKFWVELKYVINT